jgi:signal transduction histidine kinase
MLAFSFLMLTGFGASLAWPNRYPRKWFLLVPTLQATGWGVGLLMLRRIYPEVVWTVADVWSRYALAIPGAVLASVGLVILQRDFRRAGLERFGRASLWAAVAFLWYGLIGQVFTRASPLPPSNVINQEAFLAALGFPVQLLRALAAIAVAIFVIHFLRSFEVEMERRIASLQTARLLEARRRERLRRQYLKRVVSAQEAERQRIARELHDETGQALTALGMGLRGAASNLTKDPEKTLEQLRHLGNLAAESLEGLQRLISDLRPSQLDDLGLPAALRWYSGEIEARTRLEVPVRVLGQARPIAGTVKTALFRIAQEALTNVMKHADAERATVTLRYGESAAELIVEDDGAGFNPGMVAASDRAMWGLTGMEERAALLGGYFELESSIGEGTRVRVAIPYDQKSEEEEENATAAG